MMQLEMHLFRLNHLKVGHWSKILAYGNHRHLCLKMVKFMFGTKLQLLGPKYPLHNLQ
jgi:hypothetical protein